MPMPYYRESLRDSYSQVLLCPFLPPVEGGIGGLIEGLGSLEI